MDTTEAFEYAIRKDVRNNPIVREVDERRQRELWTSVVIGVGFVLVLMLSAWHHFELLRHGYQLEQLQRERAAASGSAAVERVELLRLRFEEEMPIREIARLWERDPVKLHREYALARDEFKRSLLEVISFHQPGHAERARRECEHLLSVLAGK